MKKIGLFVLPLLLATLVSCGIKDNFDKGSVSLGLNRSVLQQVNRNIFADENNGLDPETRNVTFAVTISGDEKASDSQTYDFAKAIPEKVTFVFENFTIGSIINVSFQIILTETGDVVYSGEVQNQKVLAGNKTNIQIKLSKTMDKLKDLFYPKGVFDGEWVTTKKYAVMDRDRVLYWASEDKFKNGTVTGYDDGVNFGGGSIFDYCFDGNGELWFLYYSDDCYNLGTIDKQPCIWFMGDIDAPITGYDVKIACDKVNDIFWLLDSYSSEENGQIKIEIQIAIYDNSSLKAIENSLGREIETTFSLESSSNFGVVSIAAHNNHLYMCIVYDGTDGYAVYNLLDCEYTNGNLTLKKSVNLTKLIKYVSFVGDFTPTDMEIQSDLLFVTYKVNSMDLDGNFTYGVYNYGGVFIFNLDDLVQVVPGSSPKTGVGSISGARKVSLSDRYLCYDYDGWPHFSIKGEQDETLYSSVLITPNLSFYTPDSYDSKIQFFGPQQIVAIKPKKLVILDKGVFLYVEGDSPKAKEIARLVELDIEKLVFDEQTEISFGNFKDCAELYKVSYLADKKLEGYYLDLYCGDSYERTAYLKEAYSGDVNDTLLINFTNVDVH